MHGGPATGRVRRPCGPGFGWGARTRGSSGTPAGARRTRRGRASGRGSRGSASRPPRSIACRTRHSWRSPGRACHDRADQVRAAARATSAARRSRGATAGWRSQRPSWLAPEGQRLWLTELGKRPAALTPVMRTKGTGGQAPGHPVARLPDRHVAPLPLRPLRPSPSCRISDIASYVDQWTGFSSARRPIRATPARPDLRILVPTRSYRPTWHRGHHRTRPKRHHEVPGEQRHGRVPGFRSAERAQRFPRSRSARVAPHSHDPGQRPPDAAGTITATACPGGLSPRSVRVATGRTERGE
jgi:hypothetical protein